MKIIKVSVENFRGIKACKDLHFWALTTFVWKNDSGKSAMIQALKCFFDWKISHYDVSKFIELGEKVSIEISFHVSEEINDLLLDSELLLTIRKEFTFNNKWKCICEVFVKCNDFDSEELSDLRNKKEAELNKIIMQLWWEPKKSWSWNTNLKRIESAKILIEARKTNRIDIYRKDDLLLSNLRKQYDIELPSLQIFWAEEDLDISNTAFQKQFSWILRDSLIANKNITDGLEKKLEVDLQNEFDFITSFMKKNVAELEGIKSIPNCDWSKAVKFDLELSFEWEEHNIPITHKWTWFKRLLMVAYFEYLASKITTDNSIFVIEEPEIYLHPSAQSDLLDSIQTISKKNQFILSTHSPIFAWATEGKNSILVRKDEWKSTYNQWDNYILEAIVEELGILPDYNLLKNVKHIIFVEWKDDIYFIKYYAQTVLGKDIEDDGIQCCIGWWSALKNYADLDLFKKLCPSKQYSVMLDWDWWDMSKNSTKEAIRYKCAQDWWTYFELSRREIENYCHADAIKRVYIEIINDQNPLKEDRSRQITEYEIIIDESIDVENYLNKFDFTKKFKDNHFNIKTFESMTKEERTLTDSKEEVKKFIEHIYENL